MVHRGHKAAQPQHKIKAAPALGHLIKTHHMHIDIEGLLLMLSFSCTDLTKCLGQFIDFYALILPPDLSSV